MKIIWHSLWIMITSYILDFAVHGLTNSECFALFDFYINLNGDSWYNNNGWPFSSKIPYNSSACDTICPNYNCSKKTSNTSWHTCTPYGIVCSNDTIAGSRYIFAISMETDNNLLGTISNTISNLSYLNTFILTGQEYVTGIFPTTIFSIKNIEIISINFLNHLNVYIDNNICSGKYLEIIVFIVNDINGTIPNCISNLKKLVNIDLEPCDMNKTLSLHGTLPHQLFNLPKLQQLDIGQTLVQGSLPNKINAPLLQLLSLQSNRLSGTIPESICNTAISTNLSTIPSNPHVQLFGLTFILSDNQFVGSVPTCWFNYSIINPGVVLYLGLSDNQLNYIPSWDEMNVNYDLNSSTSNVRCTDVDLDLLDNSLTGTIPEWLTLCHYSQIGLDYNQLRGELPSKWNVTFGMTVGKNKLSGTIPANLFVVAPEFLALDYNSITGSFPYQLINNHDHDQCLKYVFVNNNDLNYFPFDKVKSKCLVQLLLSDNNIKQGSIGEKIEQFLQNNPQIEALMLHDNEKISGKISNMFNWNYNFQLIGTNLKYLTLHNCDISQKLSSSMYLNNLTYLTLYNNRLSCSIAKDENVYLPYRNGTDKFLLLLGNLFSFDKISSSWLGKNSKSSHYFVNATNLYLTNLTQLFCCSLIICIMNMIMNRPCANNCTQYIKLYLVPQSVPENFYNGVQQ